MLNDAFTCAESRLLSRDTTITQAGTLKPTHNLQWGRTPFLGSQPYRHNSATAHTSPRSSSSQPHWPVYQRLKGEALLLCAAHCVSIRCDSERVQPVTQTQHGPLVGPDVLQSGDTLRDRCRCDQTACACSMGLLDVC